MNCWQARNALVVRLFGGSDFDAEKDLQTHLNDCLGCRRLSQDIMPHQAALRDAGEAPPPDWEKSWREIQTTLSPKRRSVPFPPWFLAWPTAAVAVILTLGLLVPQFMASRAPSRDRIGFILGSAKDPAIRTYGRRLEPILTDFLHESGQEAVDESEAIERRLLADLERETILLKNLALSLGDRDRLELLDELGTIIVSLTRLHAGDAEAAEFVRQVIRERELVPRLRRMSGFQLMDRE